MGSCSSIALSEIAAAVHLAFSKSWERLATTGRCFSEMSMLLLRKGLCPTSHLCLPVYQSYLIPIFPIYTIYYINIYIGRISRIYRIKGVVEVNLSCPTSLGR